MEPWDIPLLVKARLLKPLGRETAKNSVKYFSAAVVEQCSRNPKWLDAATSAISRRAHASPQKRATATASTQPSVTDGSTSSGAAISTSSTSTSPTATTHGGSQ